MSSSNTAPRVPIRLPRVLLVDDDPAVLDGLRRQLRGSFDVTTATGADEALRLMRVADPFAVVLSDMSMPGMGGIEFLAMVRQRYPGTVRMMLTGQADVDAMVGVINVGKVHQLLVKPCAGMAIESALRDAVEVHRQASAEHDLLTTAKAVVHALHDCHQEPGRAGGEGVGGPLLHREPSSTPRPLTDRLAAVRARAVAAHNAAP
jgi:DNA-binding NtrC family response regulator